MSRHEQRGPGKPWFRRIRIDWFVTAICISAIMASIFPVRGGGSVVLDGATKVLIFILFYLYGVRLEPREAMAGLKHWRLHLLILAFTFAVFPLVVFAIHPILTHVLTPALVAGVLWLSILPSTVQSLHQLHLHRPRQRGRRHRVRLGIEHPGRDPHPAAGDVRDEHRRPGDPCPVDP